MSLVTAAAITITCSTFGSGAVRAAGAQQTVFVNAVVGPVEIDVYLDGSLVAAGVDAGFATPVVTLAERVDHDVVLFDAIANPPGTRGARGDAPLAAGRLQGQARPGSLDHPATPTIVRLSNDVPDGDWYPFVYDLPATSFTCDGGFASVTFHGAADLFTTAGTGSGSGGVFGVGGGTSSFGRSYTRSIVVRGDRFPGPPDDPLPTVAFGSFDFGEVPITVDKDRFFMAYGHSGTYGASEFVFDCATQQIESVRSVARNPVFPASRFVPLAPVRLFDTREVGDPAMPSGELAAGVQVDVPVAGKVGIPATGVTAVVLNVTATQARAPGFVAVWPTGAPRPTTSNINLLAAGQTAPNLVTVPVGAGGKVSVLSSGGAHVLADVAGYFVEAGTATAGRFVPLTPARLFDTRDPGPLTGVIGPDASRRVTVAGELGVPVSGASAVVVNVTGVGAGGPGFVTVFPGGAERPEASNVNLAGAGDVAPNLVIVPLGDDGSVEFYSSDSAHVLADVFGYFTDASAPSSSAGLFVPTSPLRALDTRAEVWDPFPVGAIGAGAELVVPIADVGDVPGDGAAAVLANITGTQAVAPGFITAWPSGIAVPGVSTVNLLTAGTTRPNAALVPLGGRGDISLFSSAGTHALVDVFGYFTG